MYYLLIMTKMRDQMLKISDASYCTVSTSYSWGDRGFTDSRSEMIKKPPVVYDNGT